MQTGSDLLVESDLYQASVLSINELLGNYYDQIESQIIHFSSASTNNTNGNIDFTMNSVQVVVRMEVQANATTAITVNRKFSVSAVR